MNPILKYVTFILSVLIIGLVLFQGGKNEGINGLASKNQSLRLFTQQKARGTDKVLMIGTGVLVALLMILIKF